VSVPEIRKILVPTDFSRTADVAIGYADVLSRALGAQLYLLHVVEMTDETFAAVPPEILLTGSGERIRAYLLEQAQTRLERLRSRLGHTEVVVRMGVPREVILHVARELGADLIVVGLRGRTGIARILVGSVADHIIQHSPVPVLSVRGEAPGTG
jgi:universal stress protein A